VQPARAQLGECLAHARPQREVARVQLPLQPPVARERLFVRALAEARQHVSQRVAEQILVEVERALAVVVEHALHRVAMRARDRVDPGSDSGPARQLGQALGLGAREAAVVVEGAAEVEQHRASHSAGSFSTES
jgi:hypothetical protein